MKYQYYKSARAFTCLLIYLLIGLSTSAQNNLPGGVKGLNYWLAVSQEESKYQWHDWTGNHAFSRTLSPDNYGWLNGHPSLSINSSSENISLPIPVSSWAKSTVISLHQARDTFQERILWRMAKPDEIGVVLSTRRLGDVTKGRYFNDPRPATLFPVLHTYIQHQKLGQTGPSLDWQIGHLGGAEPLPLANFSGNLPVLMLYNRVLSSEEQRRVHSHLALQYGISLPQTSYYNASGEVIWDLEENQPFPLRIAGLGHDPVSGLYQKRSGSQMEGRPTVEISVGPWTQTNAANAASIPPGRFLIWSDDGGRLRFAPPNPEDNRPSMLERKWLMDATGDASEISTELRFHSRQLESFLKEGEQLWLLIDQTGKGEFPIGQTSYYPARIGSNGLLTFTDVKWDLDASGKDVFTFALGVPFLTLIDWQEPKCVPHQKGEMQLRVLGGKAPYQVSWKKAESPHRQTWSLEEGKVFSWSSIDAGIYQLDIEDAMGSRWQRTLQLQPSDAPEILLSTQYRLETGRPLVLRPTTAVPESTEYTWTWPDGKVNYGPILSTQWPGIYQLEAVREGCARRQLIEVLPSREHFVEEWQLFPNPVSAHSHFELRLALDQERSLNLRLLNAEGKVLRSRTLAQAVFHTFTDRLPTAGTYQLLIQAGQQHFSIPIIAQ